MYMDAIECIENDQNTGINAVDCEDENKKIVCSSYILSSLSDKKFFGKENRVWFFILFVLFF